MEPKPKPERRFCLQDLAFSISQDRRMFLVDCEVTRGTTICGGDTITPQLQIPLRRGDGAEIEELKRALREKIDRLN